MRHLLILLLWLSVASIEAQTNSRKSSGSTLSKYIGKYETNGLIVQVAANNGTLVFVVPGAPLQRMIAVDENKFKLDSFEDSFLLFVEKEGNIQQMISQSPGSSIELRKISETADDINVGDSLLTLRKSTEHFVFLYSKIDSSTIDHIADKLESSYDRILRDFKIEKIPATTVRIYPTIKRFHEGINFPDAPEYVLATAFGKDDFRMTSPGSVNREDSLNLIKYIVHEFTHCVHLNIAYAPNNPRWLWEGVANYEAGWFYDPKGMDIIRNRQFPPLGMLTDQQPEELGYVVIEAIKDLWGFDAVVNLIKKRGDTQSALHLSQTEFEKKIYDRIYDKYIDR